MKRMYTATFTPTEDGTEYYCAVPDLPGCVTTANTLQESVEMITDAANAWLVSAEDHSDPIPMPTSQRMLRGNENTIYSIIQTDTITYRAATDSSPIIKNVTIPSWMAYLADKQKINYSHILEEGLKAALDAELTSNP